MWQFIGAIVNVHVMVMLDVLHFFPSFDLLLHAGGVDLPFLLEIRLFYIFIFASRGLIRL